MARVNLFVMMVEGLLLLAVIATAQEPVFINYQGTLADSGGVPVPDGNYFMYFELFSTNAGGSPLWTENHYSVPVTGGLFRVLLGSEDGLYPSDLDEDYLYLQITVESDLLLPRMQLALVPEAVHARYLKGDVGSVPGSFFMQNTAGDTAIGFSFDTFGNRMEINWTEPLDRPPAFEMGTRADGSAEFYIRDFESDTALTFSADGVENSFKIGWMEPGNDHPAFEVSTGLGDDISMFMFNPQPEPPRDPLMEMRTTSIGMDFTLYAPRGTLGAGAAMKMVSDSLGGSLMFLNPQFTEPFDHPAMEISTGPGGDAGIFMFNPQPEPPHDPLLAMRSTADSGATLDFYKPGAPSEGVVQMGYDPDKGGFLEIHAAEPTFASRVRLSGSAADTGKVTLFGGVHGADYPLLELMSHTSLGGSFTMYSPQAGRPLNKTIEMTSTDSGGTMSFYDEIGSHIWLEIDPDSAEGHMRFFNSGGYQTIDIFSTGWIGITGVLWMEGPVRSTGLWLPGGNYPDSSYVGTDGNYLTFAHSGISEDFIGYSDNAFYFKDTPGGSESLDPDVIIGGDVGIGTITPGYKLDVEGDIECTALHETSDDRLKTNIQTIHDALDKVERLRGVSFEWNEEAESVGATVGDKQVGVLASEVEQVFPELVSTPGNGYKSVDYTKLTAVLIEAVKGMDRKITALQDENQGLKSRMQEIETDLQ